MHTKSVHNEALTIGVHNSAQMILEWDRVRDSKLMRVPRLVSSWLDDFEVDLATYTMSALTQ